MSGIKQQDKKIRYFDFLSSLEYEGCNAALKRIGPRLDMEQICRLIDETPCLSGLQRRFYKEILALRKERIIDYSLQRLQERERSMIQAIKRNRPEILSVNMAGAGCYL